MTPELFEKIQHTLDWEIAQWNDPQFIPHPRTWLSQGRWDDEPVQALQVNGKTARTLRGALAFVKGRDDDTD